MDTRTLALLNRFNRIHNLYAAVKRSFLIDADGDILHPAEMHALAWIASNPGATPGEAAASLFITRSAASQLVKKLHSKGFVQKRREADNERTVFLDPTEKGLRVVEDFLGRESTVMGDFVRGMNDLPEQKKTAVEEFMAALEELLERKLK